MNCRPGDLAYVINATVTPELNGCIVTVEKLFTGETFDGKRVDTKGLILWVCHSASGRDIPGRGLTGSLEYYPELVIADKILRPIRPGDLDESTDTDIKMPDEVTA